MFQVPSIHIIEPSDVIYESDEDADIESELHFSSDEETEDDNNNDDDEMRRS